MINDPKKAITEDNLYNYHRDLAFRFRTVKLCAGLVALVAWIIWSLL